MTGHAEGEPINLPESTQVVNVKQCGIPGGQKEITTLINAPFEATVLVWTVVCTTALCTVQTWAIAKYHPTMTTGI